MRKLVRTLPRVAALTAALTFAYGAYLYLTLPDVRGLVTSNPETTAFMELRARDARRQGKPPRRMYRWVPYHRVSPHLTKAVLVAEDARFWQHEGVDLDQIRESMEVNIERMEFARGASTITQQLAKNLYLSPSKNPVRKIRELLIARRLEAELSKQRILELYLNVIEWGNGVFGAEAAARTYFGKAAAALEQDEAALLAGAIVNPRLFDPGRPSARLRRRQQMILRRMGGAAPPPAVATPGDGPSVAPAPVPATSPAGPPPELPGEPTLPTAGPGSPCEAPPCR